MSGTCIWMYTYRADVFQASLREFEKEYTYTFLCIGICRSGVCNLDMPVYECIYICMNVLVYTYMDVYTYASVSMYMYM